MSATCFGSALDRLACEVAGWPSGAVVHTVMVMNPQLNLPPEKTFIEIKGGVPIGVKRDGRPSFGLRKTDFRGVVSLVQYRAAILKATGTTPNIKSEG